MRPILEAGIAGYGHYGRPIALNLRSAGIEVVVGEPDDERAFEAMRDGFPNFSPAEVLARSKLVILDGDVLADFASEILSGERAMQAGTILILSEDCPRNRPTRRPLGKDIAWLRPALRGEMLRAAFLDGKRCAVECTELENASGSLAYTLNSLGDALRATLRPRDLDSSR